MYRIRFALLTLIFQASDLWRKHRILNEGGAIMEKAVFLAVLVLAVFLSACGVFNQDPKDTPEGGAQAWYQSVADNDGLKLDDRTCQAVKQSIQQGALFGQAFSALGQLLVGQQKVVVDIKGLKFSRITSEGDRAQVYVEGTVRTAIGLYTQSQELSQTLIMRREDGMWKFCGSAAGAPQVAAPSPTAEGAVSGLLNQGKRLLSGSFADGDCQHLVLQREEVPARLSSLNKSFTLPADIMQKMRTIGVSYYYTDVWSNPNDSNDFLVSACVLFGNDTSVIADGFRKYLDMWAVSPGSDVKTIPVSNLGDEGIESSSIKANSVSFLWRTRNAMLTVSGKSIDYAEARRLADVMQSHTR